MDDKEKLPISSISHAGYCLRRASLILNERIWQENADTAKGRLEHDRVHTERIEKRGGQLKLYDYTVYSDTLGLLGKCDCIEASKSDDGCMIPAADFPVQLYPVEFKHGNVREEEEYEMQLCAQAMCLEEMYGTCIEEGAVFYITSHRRVKVTLNQAIRLKVRETAEKLERICEEHIILPAEYGKKCAKCSLRDLCMPKTCGSAQDYCEALARQAKENDEI